MVTKGVEVNIWYFEDVNEHDLQFVIDWKNWIENEASLLDLALNVACYYEYWDHYRKEGELKPILVLLYWKNREAIGKKFKERFNLKEDPCKETKIFIIIYLENEEEVIEDEITIYPPCFANAYIRIETDNS